MPRFEVTVGPDDAGERLDVALAAHPHVGSRAQAQRLIDAGAVSVAGALRAKGHRVAAGERVIVETADDAAGGAGTPAPGDAEVPYEVAFEDEHLIVVDKPAGVVVHPGAGHTGPTLAGALAPRARGGEPGREGIVHRLDRDTSGLLVVAKAGPVHATLTELLRRREVRREYVALVEGRPDAVTGTIEAPVGRDPARRTSMSVAGERPREARTHFRRTEALARTSLLELTLETGRTHQIRVHLEAIGHPVCGDRRYGGTACGRRLGLDRQFLHSARLAFTHPVTGDPVEAASPLPPVLERALAAARDEGPDGDGVD